MYNLVIAIQHVFEYYLQYLFMFPVPIKVSSILIGNDLQSVMMRISKNDGNQSINQSEYSGENHSQNVMDHDNKVYSHYFPIIVG